MSQTNKDDDKRSASTQDKRGQEKHWLGFYNERSRREQIAKRYSEFETKFLSLLTNATDFSTFKTPVTTKERNTVDDIKRQMDDIKVQVDAYKPIENHLDEAYRNLHGACEQLLLSIDGLSTKDFGTSGLKSTMTSEVHNITSMLATKVHLDGNCCMKCPLYGTKWQ